MIVTQQGSWDHMRGFRQEPRGGSNRSLTCTATLIVLLAAAAIAPTRADAIATASVDGAVITYRSPDDVRNVIEVKRVLLDVRIRDVTPTFGTLPVGNRITAGKGCEASSSREVLCSGQANLVRLFLGRGNDRGVIQGPNGPEGPTAPAAQLIGQEGQRSPHGAVRTRTS